MADSIEDQLIEKEKETEAEFKASKEICEIFKLAAGMFMGRVAWTSMKTTDTALLGHSST